MKVNNFNNTTKDRLTTVSATITWEDANRPQQEIYFQTDTQFATDLSCNPNAFLLATIMLAMRHGERRVLVDGAVCSQLRNGLYTAIKQLQHWHGLGGHYSVRIEATQGFEPPFPRSPQHTASFMSGGVDALATLRSNRLDFPLDHPGSIKDCFFLHGFDVGAHAAQNKNRENFEVAVASLSEMAKDVQATLIPIYTNLRHLDDNDYFFFYDLFGITLAAVAHAFSRRITTALIASSDHVTDGLMPMGSHPLLDPNYSSADVSIQHDGLRYTRLEKIALLADWDTALQHLRSCGDFFRPTGAINCGKCEKCFRTMTQLLVFDKLKHCRTYPLDDISPDRLRILKAVPPRGISNHRALLQYGMETLSSASVKPWRHLVRPLREIGRSDLADVIEAKLAQYDTYQRRLKWKDAAKLFDQKYMHGTVAKFYRQRKGRSIILAC